MLAAPGAPLELVSLYKYAIALMARFGLKGDAADLDKAISRLQEISETQPMNHNLQTLSIKTLAEALRLRSDKTGNSRDLDAAIQYEQRVLYLCPPSDPELELSRIRLAAALLQRFRTAGCLTDLDVAIRLYEQAVAFLSSSDSVRFVSLTDLAKALRLRYTITENEMDIRHASVCEREGRHLYPSDLSDHCPTSPIHVIDPINNARTVQSRVDSSVANQSRQTVSVSRPFE